MRRLLEALAAAATRRPATVVAVLAAATIALAATAASTLEIEVDLTQFGSEDSGAVQAMDRVRTQFGDPTAAVQVILDTGPGGDVLTTAGLQAVEAATQIAVEALGPDARAGADGRPEVRSLAAAVSAVAAQRGLDLQAGGDPAIARAAAQVLTAQPQLAVLASDDLDIDAGTARATTVVALLDPSLDEAARTDAGLRVRAALADPDSTPALEGVHVAVYSSSLFATGVLDAIRAEAPVLFAFALLVVLAILALAYRSLFDVAVGLAGLVATVACTMGFVALLGPGFLGLTGPPSQLIVIVPVLLVGLGIDYSVHLTARYREQRTAGQPPADAAGRALHTVGAALVLATAATATGFGASATAPLGIIADFGVFLAVGVVCAFVVMALLVPAARVLRDRRRHGGTHTAVRELGLAGLMRGPAALARRAPAAGLAVAAVLVGLSLAAAAGLETEFDRDDFVPEGSDVAELLAHQRALFGGGVTEVTYVLVDGDVTDPTLADAITEAQRGLAGITGVRTLNGTAQTVMLPPAPDGRSALLQVRTTVGDAGADRLRREVAASFTPVEQAGAAFTVTSEPIIIGEMSEELSSFQLRSIALTLGIVLLLLAAYYAVAHRRPLLGVIAMVPAVVSAALILGTMWLLGITFNVLTATLTAIAVGIGVPYGVHVVNRFVEDLDGASPQQAVATTLRSTGGALAGSALTTLGAFVVLSFSNLPPIRSLGLLGGAGIAFALLAALLTQPGLLVLWARRRERPESP